MRAFFIDFEKKNDREDIEIIVKNVVGPDGKTSYVYEKFFPGIRGPKLPENKVELLQEIKLWPRVGTTKNIEKGEKTGFVRGEHFNHLYEGISQDVVDLIN